MSTIIKRTGRWFAWAALVLGIWFLILIAMPFVGPSGRQVAVLGDDPQTLGLIVASGGKIIEVRQGAVLAKGGEAFPATLYKNGARLVLEGRIGAGCFRPRPARQAP